jgi:hypothetical protein
MPPGKTSLSLDDALKLFADWMNRRLVVRVSFAGGGRLPDNDATVRLGINGELIAVSSPILPGVVAIQGTDCNIEVDLRGSRLVFIDPRTNVIGSRVLSDQMEALLEAELTNGEYVSFSALRPPI